MLYRVVRFPIFRRPVWQRMYDVACSMHEVAIDKEDVYWKSSYFTLSFYVAYPVM